MTTHATENTPTSESGCKCGSCGNSEQSCDCGCDCCA